MNCPFFRFAQAKLGKKHVTVRECADTCLGGMEEGALDVLSKGAKGGKDSLFQYYLWEQFDLLPRQWERLCVLLQRWGIPIWIVWTCRTLIFLQLVSAPGLVGIEFLWTDLDAIQCTLEMWKPLYPIRWIQWELERRLAWASGLRRAWLVAVASFP